jgi:hypothetical protein
VERSNAVESNPAVQQIISRFMNIYFFESVSAVLLLINNMTKNTTNDELKKNRPEMRAYLKILLQ